MKPYSFTDIMEAVLHDKRRPVKKWIFVPAKFNRDGRGRFTGGKRKAFTRRIFDYTRWTTGSQIITENISRNNSLLARFKGKA